MTEEQEEQKQELEVWKPQQPFDGADLVPTIKPTGTISQLPVGGLIGRENVEPEDMVIPSLSLLQGQSDPVTDGMEGAQPGKFYLHTTGEVLVPPLRLLIVHHSKSRALFPQADNPRSSSLKKCLARDYMTGTIYGACDECPHKEWTGEDKDVKPLCSESHNFIVWTDQGPAVLRFANSSYKAAKNFLTTWTTSSKNLWGHPVLVTVKRKTKALPGGKDSTYFVMDLRWDQKEDVPPTFQASAVDTYNRIQEAHKYGKLKSTDEEAGFEE